MYVPVVFGGTVYFAQPDALKVRKLVMFMSVDLLFRAPLVEPLKKLNLHYFLVYHGTTVP